MVNQSLWLKVEKGKLGPFKAIKGFFIKEEDFVHAQKSDYCLHIRYPARGADNYNCMLKLSHNGKNENIYPVPLASLEDVKLRLAVELR